MCGHLDNAITFLTNHGLELSLVVLSPLVNRELRNLDGGIIDFADDTSDIVFVFTNFLDCAFEATPPRQHWDHLFARHQATQIVHNVNRVVAGNCRAPT
jgi:hypothetical protein